MASRLGLKVSRHKSLCPFHDDSHPSMTYSVSRNTYKCFVCDAYGDVISLTMKMLGKGFVEACRWLQNEHNVIMTEYKPVAKASVAEPKVDLEHLARLVGTKMLCKEAEEFLFTERHINKAVVRWLGLSSIVQPMPMQRSMRGSWFNAPSLLIPYRDIDGNLISVQARYLGKDNK
ncbi:MAG: CHC2 zinc finger domain-containing protein, partial [Prevotellaceae bacterium]|nr:CHC2 zinc finger domain-containing protein [Prevotellaceae bacterium]